MRRAGRSGQWFLTAGSVDALWRLAVVRLVLSRIPVIVTDAVAHPRIGDTVARLNWIIVELVPETHDFDRCFISDLPLDGDAQQRMHWSSRTFRSQNAGRAHSRRGFHSQDAESHRISPRPPP
jgi:hypothetical protein